jgi:hypothetical protein
MLKDSRVIVVNFMLPYRKTPDINSKWVESKLVKSWRTTARLYYKQEVFEFICKKSTIVHFKLL